MHPLEGELWPGPELEDGYWFDQGPINPRLHVALRLIVANQLLADDPVETWPTVQRLSRLGYDWHNVMHMIAAVVSDDIHTAMTQRREFDAVEHARRLGELPGDWPPPAEL